MADQNANEDSTDDSGKQTTKMSKKKLVGIALGGLFGLAVVGGGGAYMFGLLDSVLGIEREKTKLAIDLGVPARFPLPVIKADLKTGRCRSPFLRIEVIAQVNQGDVDILEGKIDEIVDGVRTHLRDQERQDLVGKAGTDQLRFDLVNIINNVIAPSRIQGVLFKDFILQ